MPSIVSFLTKLQLAYPQYAIVSGDQFRWSPQAQEITYDPTGKDIPAHILHELAHALLQHADYDRDIQLIGIERDAWHYARETLATRFSIFIDDHVIQASLDTYRDWLHARSTCPNCQATGLEDKKHQYRCIACRHQWRVNDARICGLRRQGIKNK